MKNPIVLPLFLGLVLAGCAHTNTDSNKLSSNDQPDATKPAVAPEAVPAPTYATDPTQVASAYPATPAPTASLDATAGTPSAAFDSSPMAATPTPPAPTTFDSSPGAFNPIPAGPAPTDVASAIPETKPAITDRITEWKLTPDDIKSDLATSGQVVRSRVAGAGEPTGPMDTNLISQINDRLQADTDTAALNIVVEAGEGVVTLNGSARSLAQIGKAIAIALDTGGVTQTISRIKLEPTP